MYQEPALQTLVELGLTPMDAQVYLFLAKKGPKKGKEMLTALRMNRQQLYRSVKNLQSKGIVSSTLERPARFSAIPFEKVLDMAIKNKTDEAQQLQQRRTEIISLWQSAEIVENIDTAARFMIVEGENYIYSKIGQMVKDAKKQILASTSGLGIIQAEKADIIKSMVELKVPSKILTNVSSRNLPIIKKTIEDMSAFAPNCAGRHIDLDEKLFPRFVIRDEDEVIFLIMAGEESISKNGNDTGLWTNSKVLVHAFKTFFEQLWRDALDIQTRIVEIETGAPVPETSLIREAVTAYKKFQELLGSAKEEVVTLTSAKGLTRILENKQVLQGWGERNVSARIMAPITSENVSVAKLLSKYCRVRHVQIGFVEVVVVDGKHLLSFKAPSPHKALPDLLKCFDNSLYSSDPEYVQGRRELLNEIWNGSADFSEVTIASVTRTPAPTVFPEAAVSSVADEMLKKDTGAVVVVKNSKPIGIITEKDILERTINAYRDPAKTTAQEIMTSPLVTIDEDRTADEALEVMRQNGIRRLVIMKGKRLVGLVTERRVLGSRKCAIANN